MAILETIDRVNPDVGVLGQLLGAPLQGGSCHSALFWSHVVKISPKTVDIKPVMPLPLMV
ncbi:hypothetical protein [Bradyrhizobium sp. C9]|uniref:hypothetical protein n=1 Tax=Bradyrhizobium sp. C9 TaxID=142585 RepID=UPI001303F960|nr:hypothetical protein [Bradyrhizobium sp. C9]